MNAVFRSSPSSRRPVVVALTLALVYAGVCAYSLLSGSTDSIVRTLILAATPIAAYFALAMPWIFPYGLYVVLLPFDNLLATGEGTITKFLGLAASVCLALWCMRKRALVFPSATLLPLAALICWMALSVLWATDQHWAAEFIPTYAGLALVYAVTVMTPIRWAEYRVLLAAVVMGSLVCAVVGAYGFYTQPPLARDPSDISRLVLRIGQASIDPNQFADALLFPIAIVLMYGLQTRSKLAVLASFGALAVLLGAVALSGSREAVLGIGAIVLYYVLRSRHRLKLALAAIPPAAVLAGLQTSLWVRFSSALDTGGAGRTSIWRVGMEAFKHQWLTGYGIGNFQIAYDQYYLSVYQPYTNGWTSAPHSIVIGPLVEIGVIGFALLVWFLVSHFTSLRSIDKAHPMYECRIMLEAAFIGLLVVAFSIDLLRYKYAWLLFVFAAQLPAVARTIRAIPSERSHPAKRT